MIISIILKGIKDIMDWTVLFIARLSVTVWQKNSVQLLPFPVINLSYSFQFLFHFSFQMKISQHAQSIEQRSFIFIAPPMLL